MKLDKLRKEEKRELVEQMGQVEEKKAIPIVKEVMKIKELEDAKAEFREKEILREGRTKIVTYNRLLAGLLLKRLKLVDWPVGWMYEVAPTDIGVVFEMRSPQKRFFRLAFKTTGEQMYDLAAVDTTAIRAENTIDRLTGADKEEPITKSPQ